MFISLNDDSEKNSFGLKQKLKNIMSDDFTSNKGVGQKSNFI